MGIFDFLTGADEQAKAIKKAQQQAIQFQREGQDKAATALNDRLAPGANYGPALSKLNDLSGLNGRQAQLTAYGDYVESPGVAFARDQGIEAARRSAAANGTVMSGRTLTDLSKYATGVAQQDYGNYWDRIKSLYESALGTATNLGSGLSNIYTGAANNMSNITANLGSQYAAAKGQAGGVLGDLLSQGAALAAFAAGGGFKAPGSTGSSYALPTSSRNAFMPAAYGPNYP